jgi:hypothetical protein
VSARDVPADTGDDLIERLARTFADECPEGCGSASSGWVAHRDDAEALLAARDAAQRADEREQWAAWLEGWLGAVGPERPTVEAVIAWLRADWRPFGGRAGTAGGSDA